MTIDKIKTSVLIALENKNYYAALVLSVTIPDICGKLEYPEKSSKERFKLWFDRYLKHFYEKEVCGKKNIFMTASDCYALRCSILHEANEDITNQKSQDTLRKIKFQEGVSVHRLRTYKNVLGLSVDLFCREICFGVDSWLNDIIDNKEVVERINLMLKIYDSVTFMNGE
jgi:hypothetical protein